jgi:hypothetical protein
MDVLPPEERAQMIEGAKQLEFGEVETEVDWGSEPLEQEAGHLFDVVWRTASPELRDRLVEAKLREIGVPEKRNGVERLAPDFQNLPLTPEGKYQTVRTHYFADSHHSGGVNVHGLGVGIDAGIDDPHLMTHFGYDVPTWRLATVETRIEAATIHEIVEVEHPSPDPAERHVDAIRNAPEKALNYAISAMARQILAEQLASWVAQLGG